MSLCVFPTAANAAAKSCNSSGSYSASVLPGKPYAWVNMPDYTDAGGGGDFRCYLAPGASNRGVTELQRGINECYAARLGIARIATDGVYGAATKRALTNVQRLIRAETHANLVVDGLYGPTTAGAMRFKASNGVCERVSG